MSPPSLPLLTRLVLDVLKAGATPVLRRTCPDDAPTPTYDALVAETGGAP